MEFRESSLEGMGKMRVLVTGATGFIGANLVHSLVDKGYEVHIFLRETSDTWRINDIIGKVSKHYCDLTDRNKVKETIAEIKPQIIFHLAIYGGYPFQKNSIKIINTNFIGTVNLLSACVNNGFECFVNTGSSSEYGVKDKPMSESDILEPINDYGVAKAASTLYCQSVAKRYSLPVFTLRLFSPYGYYESPTRLIPYLITSCLQNKEINLSRPDTVRDFVFIDDVIDAYFRVVKESKNLKSGDIFNIGSGKQHNLKEVFEIISKLTGYVKMPHWGKANERESDIAKVWEADITKAKEILKWSPKFILKDGLEKDVQWFEKNLHLYEDKV